MVQQRRTHDGPCCCAATFRAAQAGRLLTTLPADASTAAERLTREEKPIVELLCNNLVSRAGYASIMHLIGFSASDGTAHQPVQQVACTRLETQTAAAQPPFPSIPSHTLNHQAGRRGPCVAVNMAPAREQRADSAQRRRAGTAAPRMMGGLPSLRRTGRTRCTSAPLTRR